MRTLFATVTLSLIAFAHSIAATNVTVGSPLLGDDFLTVNDAIEATKEAQGTVNIFVTERYRQDTELLPLYMKNRKNLHIHGAGSVKIGGNAGTRSAFDILVAEDCDNCSLSNIDFTGHVAYFSRPVPMALYEKRGDLGRIKDSTMLFEDVHFYGNQLNPNDKYYLNDFTFGLFIVDSHVVLDRFTIRQSGAIPLSLGTVYPFEEPSSSTEVALISSTVISDVGLGISVDDKLSHFELEVKNSVIPNLEDHGPLTLDNSNKISLSNNIVINEGNSDWLSLPIVDIQSSLFLDSNSSWVGRNGNITGDPRFVGPESGDFRLLPGSPAINAGAPGVGPERDLAGNLRPDPASGLPDIGPYEYYPPSQARPRIGVAGYLTSSLVAGEARPLRLLMVSAPSSPNAEALDARVLGSRLPLPVDEVAPGALEVDFGLLDGGGLGAGRWLFELTPLAGGLTGPTWPYLTVE